MKFYLFVLASLIGFNIDAQVKLSEGVKFELRLTRFIGETENATYYLHHDYRGDGNSPVTYFKVDANSGTPTVTKPPAYVIEDKKCRLISSALINGEIIELYTRTTGISPRCKVYIVKRDPNSFKVIKDPKLIVEFKVNTAKERPRVNMYADENGIFVNGWGYGYGDDSAKFLKIFDLDLNEISHIDHNQFYPDDKNIIIKKVTHDDSGNLLYELNLKESEKAGLFKIKPTMRSTVLGLMIYNVDGERKFIIPELKESIIYSGVQYFYNYDDNTVSAFFNVHKPGSSTSVPAIGSGYAFYKWDVGTSEILEYKIEYFKYSDMIPKDQIYFHEKVNSKASFDYSADFPKMGVPNVFKLNNGDFIVLYKKLSGWGTETWSIGSCSYIMCFDRDGNEKWSTTILYTDDLKRIIGEGEKEHFYIVSAERSTNFQNGDYKFKEYKGKVDTYALTTIDLNTGEIVSRKKVADKGKTELNHLMRLNRKANKISFVVNKASTMTSLNRLVQFGIFDLTSD